MIDYAAKFPAGLAYDDFLARHGSEEHRRRWAEAFSRVQLDDRQTQLLRRFAGRCPFSVWRGPGAATA